MNASPPLSPDDDEEGRNPPAGNQAVMRSLLTAIAENGERSQRGLSADLGVALGLANTYLARCVKKGLVKASQVPHNRYAYYLTPKGFMEKGRLTREYLVQSLSLFRQARAEYSELLALCEVRGWSRIVIWGSGDIAEVAVLCLAELSLDLFGFVDPGGKAGSLAGRPVLPDLDAAGRIDAVLLADLDDPQGSFDRLITLVSADRVLVPRFLSVVRDLPREERP